MLPSDALYVVIVAAVIAGAIGTAGWTLAATVIPNRHRILAALRGDPIPAAASGAPHAPAIPQLRGVEAAAEPAFEVRNA